MFIGEMRFLMAVRFCFVRVLFALNIYVHRGVGSATRILCGIDTERTGGGGGGAGLRLKIIFVNRSIVFVYEMSEMGEKCSSRFPEAFECPTKSAEPNFYYQTRETSIKCTTVK